jgi:hypothetical protein
MASGWPAWAKPRPSDSIAPVETVSTPQAAVRPIALREVLTWELRWQRMLFRTLLPVDLLVQFGVDPVTLTDAQGVPVAHILRGGAEGSVRFELYHTSSATDATIELELADTSFNQVEVVWLAIQNPFSPRFNIDVMPDGQSTMRSVMRRNVEAEEAAMAAGLAPGQIRAGLGTFSQLGGRLETFMSCLDQHEYIAQPLFYHTAVLFEHVGCTYMQGHARMQRIDQGFSPGGDLRARLDGSSPFRRPEMADTVRGRAWAIHDGILDEPWDRVRMVKRLGVDAGVDTCPGLPW